VRIHRRFSIPGAALLLNAVLLAPPAAHGGPAAPLLAATFPLQVESQDRRLVDAAGQPFLITGDAGWSLMVRLTRSEVQQYLDDRKSRGFNTVLVSLIEHYFGGPANRYGEAPFLTPGDLATPNEAYFAHADWVIDQAAQRGMLVLLAPLYLGYQGGQEGWYQEMLQNGTSKCLDYGRYLGQRYARFPNILWVSGGDSPPLAGLAEIEAVVAGIKEYDTVHLHTAHSARGRSALDDYDRPWLDVNTTYSDCAGVVTRSRADAERARPLPFFHIEGIYENQGASASCLMGQAHHPVFLGGRGHVFGNRPVWLFDPGWPTALDSAGARYMQNAAALFLLREGASLVPDLTQTIVVGGAGDPDGTDFAPAARTASGASVLVYVPTSRTISIDTAQLPGAEFVGWWVSPGTGVAQRIASFDVGGVRSFSTPGGAPWVLVLDDAGVTLPVPGLPASPTPTLSVSLTSMSPGQALQVKVANGPGNTTDWVGLFPATAADGAPLVWRYLNGMQTAPASGLTSATLTFTMPQTPGTYDFRLFRSNSLTKLATSVTVTVQASATPTVTPSATTVGPGQAVLVTVANGPGNTTDWIGLFGRTTADGSPLAWRYLNGTQTPPTSGLTSATVTFTMPQARGTYNFRFFRSNSLTKLATSVTVTVQ
jgi:hypothetical protein